MLLTIQKRPDPAPVSPVRPADLLAACHARIRRFVRLSADLATTTAAPPADIAAAAHSLVRYHRVALPLHEADEELSVRPRLEAMPLPDAVRAALLSTEEEHRAIAAVVAELLPNWSALADAPDLLPSRAAALAARTAALRALWEPHLIREETLIFPAIALLPPEVEVAILAEIRARRAESIDAVSGPTVQRAEASPEVAPAERSF